MRNTQIAKICHETNRAYCAAFGDLSHKPWENTPAEIQASVLDGVAMKRDNPEVTPRQSHENWLRFKEKQGWIYGPVKDLERKTHPCFLPYDELPLSDRVKDELFTAIVAVLSQPGI
jgi:hypothetical protein